MSLNNKSPHFVKPKKLTFQPLVVLVLVLSPRPCLTSSSWAAKREIKAVPGKSRRSMRSSRNSTRCSTLSSKTSSDSNNTKRTQDTMNSGSNWWSYHCYTIHCQMKAKLLLMGLLHLQVLISKHFFKALLELSQETPNTNNTIWVSWTAAG